VAEQAKRRRARRQSGGIDQLPSGRWRARFNAPDGKRVTKTFRTKADADAWIATQSTAVLEGRYVDPAGGRARFSDYSEKWLAGRHDLRPRTRELYEGMLRRHLLPTFGDVPLARIQPATVRRWYERMTSPGGPGRSTAAKAYRLFSAILRAALDEELIVRSPCNIRGAGVEKAPERPVISMAEVEALGDAIGDRLRLLVLLAAWCGLRRGELLGLERQDVDLAAATVTVERTRQGLKDGTVVVGPPKTAAGRRTIAIPPHILGDVELHLDKFVGPDPTALLFTGVKGGPLRVHVLQALWGTARAKVGLEHIHLHDLRHSGNTWAATTGASTAELMARMGHASMQAAVRYQHATRERDAALAEALSKLACGEGRPAAPQGRGY
jgi:integrase